jgi:hypothetical protein
MQVNVLMNPPYGRVGQVDLAVGFIESHGDCATDSLVGTDTIRDGDNTLQA